MKWIDVPPVWLAGALALAWAQKTWFPIAGAPLPSWTGLIAGLLVGGAILLILLAFFEFRRHKTTVIPHMRASALITTGIFSRTRNPIYLADLMMLAGFGLYWSAPVTCVLLPLLFWALRTRFVLPEEARLKENFVADFQRYMAATPRWL